MAKLSALCISLVAVIFRIIPTDGLFCYQCGSVGLDGHCKSGTSDLAQSAEKVLTVLKNSSIGISDGTDPDTSLTIPYVKKCDNLTRDVCIIEDVINSQTGGVLSYIRDCSDGKTFSFDNMTIFKNLEVNNFTTCAYDVRGYLMCVSLCNTNFCNGPYASASTTLTLPVLLPVMLYLVCNGVLKLF